MPRDQPSEMMWCRVSTRSATPAPSAPARVRHRGADGEIERPPVLFANQGSNMGFPFRLRGLTEVCHRETDRAIRMDDLGWRTVAFPKRRTKRFVTARDLTDGRLQGGHTDVCGEGREGRDVVNRAVGSSGVRTKCVPGRKRAVAGVHDPFGIGWAYPAPRNMLINSSLRSESSFCSSWSGGPWDCRSGDDPGPPSR